MKVERESLAHAPEMMESKSFKCAAAPMDIMEQIDGRLSEKEEL